MNLLTNMFTDRVFGSLLRFVFDRLFGNFLKNDINFNNIDLRNCHLRDLNLHTDKLNEKYFMRTPFRFFSGVIKNLKIKLPSLSNLITESIEITVDGVDLMLVFDSVDYSKVDKAAEDFLKNQQQLEREKSGTKDSSEKPDSEDQEAVEKEIDVYKKIINRILLNLKVQVSNVCVRVLSDKPINASLLPQAPCLLFKIGSIDLHKILNPNNTDSKQTTAADSMSNKTTLDPSEDSMKSSLVFSKINNYHIEIKRISAHMLSSSQISPNEYQDAASTNMVESDFPFSYPTHAHPSTFFAIGFGTKLERQSLSRKSKFSKSSGTVDNTIGIKAELILTSDRSKRVRLTIPPAEVMIDFLVIKYLSRYVERAIEWQRATDYLNFRKQKFQASEDYMMRRRGSEVVLRPRAYSADNWSYPSRAGKSTEIGASMKDSTCDPKPKTVKIAGCDFDINYLEKFNKTTFTPQANSDQSGEQSEEAKESTEQPRFVDELKRNGLDVEDLNEEPDITENLLDSSNIEISVDIAGVYVYALKSASFFLRTEFKRRWMFDEVGSENPFHKFNPRIPVDYFLIKLTHVKLQGTKVESHFDASLTFSNLKLLDVLKVDRSLHSSPVQSQAGLNTSCNIFQSIIGVTNVPLEQSLLLSKRFSQPPQLPSLNRESSGNKSQIETSSMLFQSARDSLTADFLQVRNQEVKKIVDYVMNSTQEHFCVNYLFKFNKGGSSYKKQCRIRDERKLSYAMYQPFNTTAFEYHRSSDFDPNMQFSIRTGELSVQANLPSFYCSFYMKLILDITSILHNSSDAYFIIENMYEAFKKEHWEKWMKENDPNLNEHNIEELKGRQKKQKAYVDQELHEHMKTLVPPKLNLSVSCHFGRVVFLGEHECNVGSQTELALHSRSFRGTIEQHFEGNQSHWEHLTLFSKQVLIFDLAQTIVKLTNELESDVLEFGDRIPVTQKGIQAHVILQDLSSYYPAGLESDSKQIKFNKLFALGSKMTKVGDEERLILPSVELQSLKHGDDHHEVELESGRKILCVDEEELDALDEEDLKEEARDVFIDEKDQQSKDSFKYDMQTIASKKGRLGSVYEKFKRFKNRSGLDDKQQYFKDCESAASKQVCMTVPLINVYLSTQALEFCTELATKSIWYFDQIDNQLKQMLNVEKQFFEEQLLLESNTKPNNQTQDGRICFSCKVADIDLKIFERVLDKRKSKEEGGAKSSYFSNRFDDSGDTRLDDSLGPSTTNEPNRSAMMHEEANMTFEAKEFYYITENFMWFALRDMHATFHRDRQDQFQLLHIDFGSAFVSDQTQLRPEYGSHLSHHHLNKDTRLSAREAKTPDFEGVADHTVLLYKQAGIIRSNFGEVLPIQEFRLLSDIKDVKAYIMPHDYLIFKHTRGNMVSLCALIAQVADPDEPVKAIELSLRLNRIGLRSDLQLGFAPKLSEIMKVIPSSKFEKKTSSYQDLGTSMKKVKPALGLSMEFEMDELLVDVLPHVDYEYYIERGQKLLKVQPSDLDSKRKEEIYYTGYRLLIAVKTASLSASLNPTGLRIDHLDIANLDCLMRNSRYQNLKKNPIILRSTRPESSLFDSSFDELTLNYDFRANPFRLSSITLTYSSKPHGVLDINTKSVEVLLCADTISTLMKISDVINWQVSKKSKEPASPQEEQKVNPQVAGPHSTRKPAHVTAGSEPKSDKNAFTMTSEEDELELDFDFYKGTKEVAEVKQDEDGFDIIEEEPLPNEERREPLGLGESQSIQPSMRSQTSSFIGSNNLRFDEENMHSFVVEKQKIKLKIELTLENLQIKLQSGTDFEPDIIAPKETMDDSLSPEGIQEIVIGQREEEVKGGITLSIENFATSVYCMDANTALRTNVTYRLAVSCKHFEIVDMFDRQVSNINKILTKYKRNQSLEKIKNDPIARARYQKQHKTSIDNFFNAIFEVFSIRNSKYQDLRFFIALHSLQVNVNYHHYKFLQRFLADTLDKPNEELLTKQPKNEVSPMSRVSSPRKSQLKASKVPYSEQSKAKGPKKQQFVPLAQVSDFEVHFNIDMELPVLSVECIKDAKLEFRRLTMRNVDGVDNVIAKMKEFYTQGAKDQIIQFSSLLNLPVARTLSNLASATYNMVYLPYSHFKEERGVVSGLREGVGGFARSVASEGLSFTQFMTNTVSNVVSLTGMTITCSYVRLTCMT